MSQNPRRKNHICLPPTLLKELTSDPTLSGHASVIYDEHFQEFRHSTLTYDANPDFYELVSTECAHFRRLLPTCDVEKLRAEWAPGRRRTYLHLAAVLGDLPLAYECVRLRLSVDACDDKGCTPLSLALEALGRLEMNLHQVPSSCVVLNREDIDSQMGRYRKIARMLIEQHANVNVPTRDGSHAIYWACWGLEFDIVELMLKHGAQKPNIKQDEFVRASGYRAADTARMGSIVRRTKRIIPRPPRPCPCWSGKLLSDCHASGPKPYPPEFLCVCGSWKTFRNCCGRRNFGTYESWFEDYKRIVFFSRRNSDEGLPEEMKRVEGYLQRKKGVRMDGSVMMMEEDLDMQARHLALIGEALLERGDADPAFVYGVKITNSFPRPWNKQYSKLECESRAERWNHAIDQYIDLKTDSRTRLEIEQQNKVGIDGGPLYKRCEAAGCTHVEGPQSEKMKCCGRCKRKFYCSTECQRGDWPLHKSSCKTGSHLWQMLPSQRAYAIVDDEMSHRELAGIAYAQSRPTAEEAHC